MLARLRSGVARLGRRVLAQIRDRHVAAVGDEGSDRPRLEQRPAADLHPRQIAISYESVHAALRHSKQARDVIDREQRLEALQICSMCVRDRHGLAQYERSRTAPWSWSTQAGSSEESGHLAAVAPGSMRGKVH